MHKAAWEESPREQRRREHQTDLATAACVAIIALAILATVSFPLLLNLMLGP